MLWSLVLAFCAVHLVVAHEHAEELAPKGKVDSPADDIRKRWSAAEVMHDLEHVKHDLKNLIALQQNGEITKDEASFYYFRMHDFDDNNLLDGQEVMAGMSHSLEHHSDGGAIDIERVIALTDDSMLYDRDNDGFISYPEMRVYVREKMR